jgi:hypothetical protein
MDVIESNINLEWDWNYISWNPNLTMEFIEAHPDKQWCWSLISKNPGITMDAIDDHLDKPWDWYNGISYNPNLVQANRV